MLEKVFALHISYGGKITAALYFPLWRQQKVDKPPFFPYYRALSKVRGKATRILPTAAAMGDVPVRQCAILSDAPLIQNRADCYVTSHAPLSFSWPCEE